MTQKKKKTKKKQKKKGVKTGVKSTLFGQNRVLKRVLKSTKNHPCQGVKKRSPSKFFVFFVVLQGVAEYGVFGR
jgi:hypothetical protein